MRTLLLTILIAALIIGALFYILRRDGVNDYVPNDQSPSPIATTTQDTTIEDYVRQNISSLSPEKEVLGGTFYVTNIEAQDGTGTVKYEDGHVAYIADFTYTIDGSEKVTITSFKPRK